MTKAPQVFRNPGGSPALQNWGSALSLCLLFYREDMNRMAGGDGHTLLAFA